jgi:hypothetical protein
LTEKLKKMKRDSRPEAKGNLMVPWETFLLQPLNAMAGTDIEIEIESQRGSY